MSALVGLPAVFLDPIMVTCPSAPPGTAPLTLGPCARVPAGGGGGEAAYVRDQQ